MPCLAMLYRCVAVGVGLYLTLHVLINVRRLGCIYENTHDKK
ncbi:hypothetical protein T11_2608 [Trichinella zimbabwensis]|uniref:Uncharacterized protein n=1 Tax=Trichinella zimbabwensis TaxID=268475 RepID=A0A0V1G848_9BILA|nr:hypothetical protein T11_2608 [Trichinella zimbabwensis]